jgi:hypothetical protein
VIGDAEAGLLDTSLAPSPTAIVSSRLSLKRSRSSISACSLASRPRMGSATSPVRIPRASVKSVLARCSSNPIVAASCVVKAVKPPDTTQV